MLPNLGSRREGRVAAVLSLNREMRVCWKINPLAKLEDLLEVDALELLRNTNSPILAWPRR